MSDILNKIVAVKHEEVAAAKQRLPLPAMRALLGGDEADACFALASPLPPERLAVVRRRAQTRFALREAGALALAGGGTFLTEKPSSHTKTCMELLPLFTNITARAAQQNAKAWLITLQ